ncbi:LysE family translocator [Thalassococcus sp. CAU 1522]|uniref:LysE family translocator n=1 Tax=Thalassococcus arenae TaxID=2851652 RepID=A0ABS6N823_9RHOB|nr:LysE family translocator [Thalassococcus arenae]MBV2360170.1 LysE family translocator [Thalassococcus arenae]
MLDTLLAMEAWTLAAFMGAAMVLYLTPGADMMFTIASGVSGGPRAGMAAACGISLGVLVHTVLAAAGLAALMATSPAMLDVVRYAGAAYLAWLAWQAWRDRDGPARRAGRAHVWQAFLRGFVTNMLNPKVGLFVLAFLPQFADPSVGPVAQQILILGVLLAIGGVITDGLYGIFAGLMADRIARRARVMNRISAVIFGGLAARLAWS